MIVLDRTINSMIEFKQIIGRGTRIAEEYGKTHFTIMDFRNATDNFADPDFDGDPVQIYVAGDNDDIVPPPPGSETDDIIDPNVPPETPNVDFPMIVGEGQPPTKYVVGDVAFSVAVEQIQYMDANGDLITESLRDYTRKKITSSYSSLDVFLQNWTEAKKKSEIIEDLENEGVFFEELARMVGRDYDAFDLVCHVAYGQKPMTRKERANNVKKRDVLTKYGGQARVVLSALFDKFSDLGLAVIEIMIVLKIDPIDKLRTPIEIFEFLGGKEMYLQAVHELSTALYAEAA